MKKPVGRPELFPGEETIIIRVKCPKSKEKEMKADIKEVQEKYKNL